MSLLFCHGLESGPHGRKYHALCDAGLAVESPDFQGMVLAERVKKLVQLLQARQEPQFLVGSSYGGITAVLASMQLVEQGVPIGGILLLAPALSIDEPPASQTELRAVAPTTLIHGRRDDVVPLQVSRDYAAQQGVTLIEVEDDHRLAGSLERIVQETRLLLQASSDA
ncbi:MAG: alpha/beta hydrolase [Deltaproteobacteria bacterium]|nr:MAG: alpha/beta hydrolase [Deltaproteobacteria bacterium]